MKNFSILIMEYFFLSLAPLGEARQSINHNISFFLMIIDLKMVSKELFGSADLTRLQVFCIYKLMEVIMVNKNKNLVFATCLLNNGAKSEKLQ